MSQIKDVENLFQFWVNYEKKEEVSIIDLQKALELMENVVEKLAEEEGVDIFSLKPDNTPEDKVLGEKTQAAFEAFSKFISKYRKNQN